MASLEKEVTNVDEGNKEDEFAYSYMVNLNPKASDEESDKSDENMLDI